MKERCSVFDIECGYAPTCYSIRPERCVESMSKVDSFRKLWEEKYDSPMEESVLKMKDEMHRKRAEDFVAKSLSRKEKVATKTNKIEGQKT